MATKRSGSSATTKRRASGSKAAAAKTVRYKRRKAPTPSRKLSPEERRALGTNKYLAKAAIAGVGVDQVAKSVDAKPAVPYGRVDDEVIIDSFLTIPINSSDTGQRRWEYPWATQNIWLDEQGYPWVKVANFGSQALYNVMVEFSYIEPGDWVGAEQRVVIGYNATPMTVLPGGDAEIRGDTSLTPGLRNRVVFAHAMDPLYDTIEHYMRPALDRHAGQKGYPFAGIYEGEVEHSLTDRTFYTRVEISPLPSSLDLNVKIFGQRENVPYPVPIVDLNVPSTDYYLQLDAQFSFGEGRWILVMSSNNSVMIAKHMDFFSDARRDFVSYGILTRVSAP